MTDSTTLAHTSSILQNWKRVKELKDGSRKLILDGDSLDTASVIAVARFGIKPEISSDEKVTNRIQLSVDALTEYISKEWIVYGVNTGFGGSADTRTRELIDLQIGALQHTQSGIITKFDKSPSKNHEREPSHVMPLEWVRGAMVIRANQNLRGHSAVRLEVLQSLVRLLHRGITPMVPLRGTISASGDLMPMSYIAGAVTGNPDIFVQLKHQEEVKVLPAPEALRLSGLSSSKLGPKEALGLINGTAPSVSVGSIVLYDAQRLAYLAQMLTAFAAESMAGNVEWALPFIHAARPHAGQIEAATNIRRFLHGSEFVEGLETRKRTGDGIWQDRYSTRTAPQWIGPYLEDLLLSQTQIDVELNSTSDNPLVEPSTGEVYSGGNFQATTVTSAMDKTRLALQMIGRMLFSQVTEMINPSTNHGLEANLNASDRENFTMKGIDVNMAAYMSELAALSHPVSSHIMSAEMHNQGINSLALISARRTMEAVDLVAHMSACHLYVSCQAVDLRAIHRLFLARVKDVLFKQDPLDKTFHGMTLTADHIKRLGQTLFPVIESTWYHWNNNSWKHRIQPVAEAIMAPLTNFLVAEGINCSISELNGIAKGLAESLTKIAESDFDPSNIRRPSVVATQLGDGTSQLYTWVRSKLQVPMHIGIADDPLYNVEHEMVAEDKRTIGSRVSVIYESIRGSCLDMVMDYAESLRQGPRDPEEYETLCKLMVEM